MEQLQGIKQRFGIVGQSPLLERALQTALRVAATDLTVLITGESGVGKEVFSRIIHALSARKHNAFIAINCGAIPEGTINSELFGHEKGAFTGANAERKGYFEAYDGGTLFLDEIGEMPLDTQAYLLRILENGEFIRVGSNKVLKTDVRIIGATNVDLEQRIKKGKFREDLFYRLNTVMIEVPPLRKRPEDIFLLFRKFTVEFAEKYRTPPVQLDERSRLLLERYSWPGNVRELKNVAEKLSVLSEERQLNPERILEIVPHIQDRHLPMIVESSEATGLDERDILYKVLFDMKKDMTDLKSLVFELIRTNNLQVTNLQSLQAIDQAATTALSSQRNRLGELTAFANSAESSGALAPPQLEPPAEDFNTVLLPHLTEDDHSSSSFNTVEILDENLRLEDHEKNLITKALRKFKGRRKEAAQELGISERTLYRKIKQYNL